MELLSGARDPIATALKELIGTDEEGIELGQGAAGGNG
jgi:hypothetical protein